MLDQRRAKQEGYITLREAAALTDYSADYIGQLIRSGKIRGQQVYNNVAWVTTEEEICAYLDDKTRTVESAQEREKLHALRERVCTYALYTVIALLALALLVMQYIFYVTVDDRMQQKALLAEVAQMK